MSEQNYGQPNPQEHNNHQGYGYNPPQEAPAQTFDAYGNPIAPDAKTLSVLSHLSALILNLVSLGFLSLIGPLIFWFIYKDKPGHQFTAANSARAFNFNFAMWLVNMTGYIILLVTFGLGLPVSFILWLAAGICLIVFPIIAAVKANQGEVYNYPMQIRIIK